MNPVFRIYFLTKAQSTLLPKTNALNKFNPVIIDLTHNEWQQEYIQPQVCAFEFRFKLYHGDILLYKDYTQPLVGYKQMTLISK